MTPATRGVLRFLQTVLRLNVLDPIQEAKERAEATRLERPTLRQEYARDLTDYLEGPRALQRQKEPTP